jgi:threonine synthase
MRFLSTRGHGPAVSFRTALFEGLAPDGGLYVPERIPRWPAGDLAALTSLSLVELGLRVLLPFVGEVDEAVLRTLLVDALNFPIPVVFIEPGVYALELFHGPTQAFKDVGARVMARLMAALHEGGAPLTVLVATSGDTGGAVAHAFHGVAHTRVVILYPAGRVSPTQEAQLTMFNGERGSNVLAYAVSGSFDDCQHLTKEAFADGELSHRVRLTSANSINIGRLLPQMVYYAQGVARLREDIGAFAPIVATPSGNFGNLTAGLMQKQAGLPIRRFVAATNVNDVVPVYLQTGRFEPRASVRTIANAMDVGNPSNFERIMWLYGGSLEQVREDIAGSCHTDDQVRETIRRVYGECGYVLDPHSAIAYLGLKALASQGLDSPGLFVATAHPAKFSEIVEPILGRPITKPAPLVEAIERGRHVMTVHATLEALKAFLQ